MKFLPPKWAARFLDWLTADGRFADIPGDLHEEFAINVKSRGIRYANKRYVWTVLLCLRPFILREKFNFKLARPLMIRNYWLVSRRFLVKNKLYAGINIFGLAIGIACSLVLLVYVTNELSYDRFHQAGASIYRILVTSKSQDEEITSAIITAAIAPTLKDELPEIVEYVRFSAPADGFLSIDDKKINIVTL